MQPLAGAGAGAAAGVQSAAFAALSERDVAPDSLFFHKYYSLAGVQVRHYSHCITLHKFHVLGANKAHGTD